MAAPLTAATADFSSLEGRGRPRASSASPKLTSAFRRDTEGQAPQLPPSEAVAYALYVGSGGLGGGKNKEGGRDRWGKEEREGSVPMDCSTIFETLDEASLYLTHKKQDSKKEARASV